MDNERYTDLCRGIRELCRRLQWYGPDGGAEGYRGYFDAEGKLHVREITHDYRTGFEFPPATEEQLRATEESLGFPLPPMLRALYALVANGGFGPAYGITGARGGYYFGDDGRYETVDMCTDSDPTVEYIDLAAYEKIHGNAEKIELRPGMWPARFLHLCYDGCGEDHFLDGNSGRVYYVGCGSEEEDGFTLLLSHEANSLEEWLENWLQGETEPWQITRFRRV